MVLAHVQLGFLGKVPVKRVCCCCCCCDIIKCLLWCKNVMNECDCLKATPRPKPRAFPRTNPSYVGTHRGDGYSSYRRVDDVGASSHSQRAHNLSVGEENPYNLLSDYTTTRQHRPVTSHSFDISDTPSVAAICSLKVSISYWYCADVYVTYRHTNFMGQ